jgi:tetratricopeptide (TPR) repeat protein
MANVRNSAGSTIFLLLLFAGILWISWQLSGNSNSAEATFERGRKSLRSHDWNGAVTCFTRVIEADPKFSAAYADRAMAEQELKQYDKAISDCDRAVGINPSDDFAFKERGMSKAGKGDPEGAVEDYLHAARINPTNRYVFYEMAEADSQLLNFNEEIACLTRAPSNWTRPTQYITTTEDGQNS